MSEKNGKEYEKTASMLAGKDCKWFFSKTWQFCLSTAFIVMGKKSFSICYYVV